MERQIIQVLFGLSNHPPYVRRLRPTNTCFPARTRKPDGVLVPPHPDTRTRFGRSSNSRIPRLIQLPESSWVSVFGDPPHSNFPFWTIVQIHIQPNHALVISVPEQS
ncbi:hypothetical protein PGTUg99_015156 [Puccinia graminis f. sp. tritici]|uniref:Uncharacterized protein n=1 Tax=Puccinia graminis f. sp. tritici TaxID=56615 RepID=A0A5B0RAM6_PUCGR|nr:hypothetical protein PGTUg99_034579 [Puccinia graminis f. sp. tritici]KAA1132481.1 hypothetical protein PGTUg99_015156 [Puccinia graminis f. sp. tritici]